VARGRGAPRRQVYHQRFERGKPVSKLETIGKTKGTGTKITFLPDAQIFPVTEFSGTPRQPPARNGVPEQGPRNQDSRRKSRTREEIFKYKGGIASSSST
jgi:DNA gyrase subunit B